MVASAPTPVSVIDPLVAAAALAAGDLAVIPTETVYGIAARADIPAAIDGLIRAGISLGSRSGSGEAPRTLHCDSIHPVLDRIGPLLPLLHARLLRRLLPGPVTIAVELQQAAAEQLQPVLGRAAELLLAGDLLRVRVPDHGGARAVLAGAGGPVVAEALPVVPSGAAAVDAVEAGQALARAGVRVGALLDGGRATLGRRSAFLRLRRVGGWTLEHPGPFDSAYIERMAARRILFVCTGNTCRSPMAEALARSIAAASGADGHVSVSSAGVAAMDGAGFSPEAVDALRRQGSVPLQGRSRRLTPALLAQADEVYVMTGAHRAAVLGMDPAAGAKVRLLDPDGRDVADPIGWGQDRYDSVAADLRRMVERRLLETDR